MYTVRALHTCRKPHIITGLELGLSHFFALWDKLYLLVDIYWVNDWYKNNNDSTGLNEDMFVIFC